MLHSLLTTNTVCGLCIKLKNNRKKQRMAITHEGIHLRCEINRGKSFALCIRPASMPVEK